MLEKVSRNTSIRSFHLLIKCKFFLLKLPMDTAGGAGMCPSPRDPWETSVKRTGVLLLHGSMKRILSGKTGRGQCATIPVPRAIPRTPASGRPAMMMSHILLLC